MAGNILAPAGVPMRRGKGALRRGGPMDSRFRYLLAIGTSAAAMLLAGAPAFGQSQAPPTTQPQTQSQAPEAQSASQPQKTIQMVQAQASLDHTLDAKKAQQGEAVTAKLSEKVQIPNAQELPRNTVLEGHVDQVKPSEHKSNSVLVVTFDKAKLKDGQELPIKATVLAVSEPSLVQQEQAASGAAPGNPSVPMSTPSPQGGVGPGGTPTSGPAQPMDMPQASSSSQHQAQRNGVPGVTLQSDIHGSTSATFTSQGKNVRVPDGTQMEFAIAVIPPGVKIQ